MVKTTITLTVDSVVKQKAMTIIQGKMNTSVSAYVEQKLREMVENDKKRKK